MDFFIKRLRYETMERAYLDLLNRGLIDEGGNNTEGTLALLDVPGGDFILLINQDIYFENEITYHNSLQEYIGGRPNNR